MLFAGVDSSNFPKDKRQIHKGEYNEKVTKNKNKIYLLKIEKRSKID